MINVGFLPLDILIILIILAVLYLVSFKTGKKLLVSLILSLYPTVLIFGSLPFSQIGLSDNSAQAIVFLIFYILMIVILRRNITVKKYYSNFRKFLDYFLLSISYVILIVSIYINSVNSLSSLYNFSGAITNLVSMIPYSITLLIPILIILITNRKDLE
jgi:CRISPR/Cas system-associated protein endoribonuclease Cas2